MKKIVRKTKGKWFWEKKNVAGGLTRSEWEKLNRKKLGMTKSAYNKMVKEELKKSK